MNKRTVAAVVAAGILTGGTAAVTAPAFAADAVSSTTDHAAARLSAIKDALKSLVSDGTLTQTQADKVATTLAQSNLGFGRGDHRGPRGPLSPEATAKVLGITPAQLRTAVESGQTLAQIAATKGMSKADLISGLTAAAKAQLAIDLKAGRITQARYDDALSHLSARITEVVDRVGPPHGFAGDHDGDGPPPAGAPTG